MPQIPANPAQSSKHTSTPNAATRRTHKRQRRSLAAMDVDTTPGTNHLARIPLEMLHEVLSWTKPPDILALSRANRYFCAVLVSDSKIWRDARKRFKPYPIPDPSPNWTESAYIAFIFDEKICEVCKRKTFRTPFSYSIRAFICYDKKCENAWLDGLKYIKPAETDPRDIPYVCALQSWLPYHVVRVNPIGQIVERAYNLTTWNAALERHKESTKDPETYAIEIQEIARKAARLPKIMKHAEEIGAWDDQFEKWCEMNRDANIKFLKGKAVQEGWRLGDFVNTPLYRNLRESYQKFFEHITEKVYERVRDQFREEVMKCGEARIRRLMDNTARLNREDLRSYWNSLKTNAKDPLPPYSEFRHFNIVKALERKNTTEAAPRAYTVDLHSVRHELKTSFDTRMHIEEEIDNWLKNTRKKLAVKLGDPYSLLATIQEHIHPVDRTTAWFKCTRCHTVGRSRLEDLALTFANVCTHQCQGISRKTRVHCPWDVRFFEADTKAIASAKEVLRVCGLDERRAKRAHLDAFGCRFLCKSCEGPIIMAASSVIGHSKRHDKMTLELVTEEHASAMMVAPLERGLVSKLMGPSKSGESIRKQERYACRHCNMLGPFTFDGLRSHLKKKHLIGQVRDEDVSTF